MPISAPAFNAAQLLNDKLTWDHITKLVRFWQTRHGLEVDGKAGGAETIPHLDATEVTELPDLPDTLMPVEVMIQGEPFKVYVEEKNT